MGRDFFILKKATNEVVGYGVGRIEIMKARAIAEFFRLIWDLSFLYSAF